MKLLKKIKKALAPARKAPAKRAAKPKRKVKTTKPPKKVKKLPPKPAKSQKKPQKVVVKKGTPKKSLQRAAEFAQSLKVHEVEKKQAKQYTVLPGGNNTRVAMLLPLLRELVKKGTISDWLINVDYQRSANLYVERNFTIEDEASSIKEDVHITIYERFPDGTIGEAQLPIVTADASEARQAILEAKDTCSYARKKAFTLAQPSDDLVFPASFDEKMLHASFQGDGLHTARDMYERIRAAMILVNDVKTNAFEVLTSAGTVRVINSNGVDVSFHKTAVYLEIVLSCKSSKEESEFLLSRVAVSPEQIDIQTLLQQQVQIVRDAANAVPNPGFSGDVLLAGQSVTEVFAPHHELNPLILHTSAKLDAMGLSSLHMHQPVGHFIGELPTITAHPALPLGLGTAPVDEEGTPLRTVDLIRSGVFVSHVATARYAQYLGVPATGNLSNIQLSPGATREQHLRGNNYLEIVSFSWFSPNAMSGDFAAEIRLGYLWVNGRKTPVKGGTFTGNMFKNILNVRFSKETMLEGTYYGPRAVLFKHGVVTKLD